MELFRRFLIQEIPRCRRHGVQVRVIGHRHRLRKDVSNAIERCEAATAGGRRMTLRLAVDYSSREQLAKAARSVIEGCPEEMERALRLANHPLDCAPPVDLLVRTSGEKRLSDFLLWECAYAELHFVDTFWPDFGAADVEEALLELSHRQRRFGGLGEATAETPADGGDPIRTEAG
jgi:undecaprenyl diphosphate synthase